MELLKNFSWFVAGVLFASIGWGFISLMLWNMYQRTARKYEDLRNKALKEVANLRKTGGFRL